MDEKLQVWRREGKILLALQHSILKKAFCKIHVRLATELEKKFSRKVAACASMSDLFIRFSGFSNVKKDAISNARKLIQPLLKLLLEDGSEALWVEAVIFKNHVSQMQAEYIEEGKDREALKFLVPPGKDAPSLLGGEDGSHKAENRYEQVIMFKASVLMSYCRKMLTSPYPVQVESILLFS
ncbi:hypothetical protein GIB67_016845 [Kingdonia uniflora]|uniref:Uncharacterized protein n=1 Tax=Kingdonia uniflora TaxID=39325 RepID=A0A7J7LQ35_9MAGN|nr:hypothetical protein GIB67_016845 [Kingdonia uniflora]